VPPSDASCAGIVLAGGYSTRFGEDDKALADLDGRPMLAHVVDGLAPAVDAVVVSCRQSQVQDLRPILRYGQVDAATVPDPIPDRGPLAGLANAVDAVETQFVTVAPCDMPFLDTAVVSALRERIGENDAAIPRVDGECQPACAVYRTASVRQAASDALDADERSLFAMVSRLDAETVPADTVAAGVEPDPFLDVNTPDAFRRAIEER
jgi:molybdopterin-guanine dinucleotide biosynthesis protein A